MPFLDALAAEWLERAGGDPLAVSRGLILLPTRRAARALAEAFLRASGGRPLLLPRITALGALDEAPLTLAGALDLPPAVEPAQRLAALTRLILAMRGANGAPRTADRAWPLAAELAALMDEAERAEIDLARRLPEAADPAYAAHWAQTLKFLHIVTRSWPDWLAEQGLMNPAARQVALLDAQAAAWDAAPPAERVLVAGTTGGIPAVARLLRVVAHLPNGAVVLPGLDTAMSEHAWAELDDSHPQAGLARLLHGLGATRDDVRPWPAAAPDAARRARGATLSRALLPANALAEWRNADPATIEGLMLLSPADQQEEAAAIAMVLRDALETPEGHRGAGDAGSRPGRPGRDRTAALRRGGGRQRRRAPGRHAAGGVPAPAGPRGRGGLAPVPLLALLKHPLAAAGLSPAACRAAARALELACLRGPRPQRGVAGLRRALDRAAHRHRTAGAAGSLPGAGAADRHRGRGGAGAGAGRADRGRRAPRRHRRAAGPVPAVGRRGRRGAGDQARRGTGGAAAAAGPAARSCCRGCWTRCCKARWCAAAAPCADAAAPSIRACSSGDCWRRGCRRRT